jgi:DNA-binding NarL/FixJ family response regulator
MQTNANIGRAHYLIVEDDAYFSRALQSKLRSWGETTLVRNYDDATYAFRRKTYSALFQDVRLPGGVGLDVLKAFRRLYPSTPAMVLTGLFEQADSILAWELGAAYVIKPISLAALQAFVCAVGERESALLNGQPGRIVSTRLSSGDSTACQRTQGEPLTIHDVSAEFCLTRAERNVYSLMALGLSNREIAQRLSVSIETVRTHVHRILSKLDVHSRAQAIVVTRSWLAR